MQTINGAVWWLLIFFVACAPSYASGPSSEQGVIVAVQRHDAERAHYGKFTDAPAPAEEFRYDVSIRTNCWIYLARYKNWTEYVPSALTANQTVQISPEKRFLRVKGVGSDELILRIVSRTAAAGNSCASAP